VSREEGGAVWGTVAREHHSPAAEPTICFQYSDSSAKFFIYNRKLLSLLSAEEFIAAITQHIPNKSLQLVRYHGWYSNRMRGERNKLARAAEVLAKPDDEIKIIDVSGYKPRRIPPPIWLKSIVTCPPV
jgi:hypothetical protein